MTMAWVTLTDHTPLDDMESRKQGGRSVAFVVVSEGAAAARFEWQSWLSAIEGLNLALLVHTQHDGILRRRQVYAHDISKLLNELWIPRQLEGLGQMRLELMVLPDTVNRVFAHLLFLGQRARAPMGRTFWFTVQRRIDDLTGDGSAIARFSSSASLDFPDATDALLANSTPPQRNGEPMHVQFCGDCFVVATAGRGQNDSGPQHHLLRRRTRPNPLLRSNNLCFGKHYRKTLAWHPAMLLPLLDKSSYLRDRSLGLPIPTGKRIRPAPIRSRPAAAVLLLVCPRRPAHRAGDANEWNLDRGLAGDRTRDGT